MHQPDLLPYSGFWHKMAKADVFEINANYQFLRRGYQRRVRMRDAWANVPVVGKPTRDRILDVRIDPEAAPASLADTIYGRYAGSRYWRLRGDDVMDLVRGARCDRLWQFNLHLIIGVRDLLGITTPVSVGSPLKGAKSEAIVNALQEYRGVTQHLAGPGARSYMGDGQEFREAGIELCFSQHAPVSGDSIVTVLMDHRDPLEVVLREEAA